VTCSFRQAFDVRPQLIAALRIETEGRLSRKRSASVQKTRAISRRRFIRQKMLYQSVPAVPQPKSFSSIQTARDGPFFGGDRGPVQFKILGSSQILVELGPGTQCQIAGALRSAGEQDPIRSTPASRWWAAGA